MAFKVELLLEAVTAQAEAGLKSVQRELGKTGAGARDLGQAERAGAAGTDALGRAADKAAADLAGLDAQQTRSAQSTRAMGQSHELAAGSVGNLTAQFNDIGLMLAAGQNPLQLAIQQGTQISQVIGPMGAGAAVRALGTAFLGMLSPVSLLTMGVIAAGGALVQWLTSANGDAKTAAEAVDDLRESVDAYRQSIDAARESSTDLFAQYGPAVGQARDLLRVQEEMNRVANERALSETTRSLASTFGESPQALQAGDSIASETERLLALGDISAAIGLDPNVEGNIAQVEKLAAALSDLAAADGPREQAAAMGVVREAILDATGGVENMTDKTFDLYRSLLEGEQAALRLNAALQEAERPVPDLAARGDEAGNRDRLDLMQQMAAADADVADQLEKAEDSAASMLADLQGQVSLQAAIAQYGADSAQVAGIRAAQELAAYGAMLDTLPISAALKEELYNAKMEALGLAGSGLPGMLSTAAGAAGTIYANLSAAAGAAWDMAAGVAASAYDTMTGAAWRQANLALGDDERGTQGEVRSDVQQYRADEALATARANAAGYNRPGGGASAGPAGGGSAAAETSAVQDLIQSLNDEIELGRELDPVQQEMLRNREALAGASEAERAEVEELIRTRNAEAEALERVQSQMADTRDLGRDLISGMISDLRAGADGWDILANALGRFADKLIDLGTDSLADVLFGTGQQGGGSGLLGSLLQGILFPSFGGIGMGASGKVASVTKHALGAVYDQPLYFSLGGAGQLGVMAEAGAEAIMPLTHAMGGGVGARLGAEEITLPLTRLASGKLGVDLSQMASPFALGDAFGDIAAVSAPASWRQAGGTASAPATSAPAAGDINIHLDLRGATITEDILTKLETRIQAAVKQAVSADNRAFKAATKAVLADKRAR